jgi:hypothetical protein
MYIPAIPFSAMLSVMFIGTISSMVRNIKEYKRTELLQRSPVIRSLILSTLLFVVVAQLIVALFLGSPLFDEKRDWRASGDVASLFLNSFSKIVPQLPWGATVKITGLPWINTSQFSSREIQSVTQLHQRSVQSWLDINHPDDRLTVQIRRYGVYLKEVPRDFDLQTWTNEDGSEAMVKVKPVY